MVPSLDQQMLSSAHMSMPAFSMTLNQEAREIYGGVYPESPPVETYNTSFLPSPTSTTGFNPTSLLADPLQQSHLGQMYGTSNNFRIEDSDEDIFSSALLKVDEHFFPSALLKGDERSLFQGPLYPELNNIKSLDLDEIIAVEDLVVEQSLPLSQSSGFSDLTENSSPPHDFSIISSNHSSDSGWAALLTDYQTDESASTNVTAVRSLPLPSSSLPKVISTAPRVQPIGRKKIDLEAQKYVTTEDSDDANDSNDSNDSSDSDDSDDSSSSSDSEDSDSSSCDPIDVETVEGETPTVKLPVKSVVERTFKDSRLIPVSSNYLRQETKAPSLPPKQVSQSKSDVDLRSCRRNSRSNKENKVLSAKSTAPVKHSHASYGISRQTDFPSAQQPKVPAKQLTNNNLGEPSEPVAQLKAPGRKLSNGSATSLKTVQPLTVPTRKLSGIDPSKPLKTVQPPRVPARKLSGIGPSNPLKTVRQPGAAINKPKTTTPIILTDPPEIDPDSKKGRRSRSTKSTRNNESSAKKKTPERTKRKVSDVTKPSVVKSSPPSAVSSVATQEKSSASTSQIPSQSAPQTAKRGTVKPSSCSSSQMPPQSTPKPSSCSSSQTTPQSSLVPISRKLKLVEIPDFVPVPASKPKRPDGSIRRAKISTVNGDKQTILVLDNVTGNEPAKTIGSVKAVAPLKPVISVKTVASAEIGSVNGMIVAHDHSYFQTSQNTKTVGSSTSTQPLGKLIKTANTTSLTHMPQRTKTMVVSTSTQSLGNQLVNLIKTSGTVSNSHTPQTKTVVASTSTQSRLIKLPDTAKTISILTLNELNAKYHKNYKIAESIVNDANGVPKKKLSVVEYRNRQGKVQKVNVGVKPQAQLVQKPKEQAALSNRELLSRVLAAKQPESSKAGEGAMQIPGQVVLQPILLAKKEDEVRIRTIRPPPNLISVHTVNRWTNTETKLDDGLIAALHQSSEPHKLTANRNTLFHELLAVSMENAKPPAQPVETSSSDDFECKTIRHRTKDEVSRIQTRSIEVQTDLHFGVSGYSSRNSVRSPSPATSHHSLQSYHEASNSSVGESRCSRSYTPTSPDVMGGWSPHSNSSLTSRYSPSSCAKRKYDDVEYIHPSKLTPSWSGGSGVKRKHEDVEHAEAVAERRVLFVGGLESDETSTHLERLFARFGTISHIKICPRKSRPDKFAFLTFTTHQSCVRAFEQCKGDPKFKYEVGFGGRRNFCDAPYVDFDNGSSSFESSSKRVKTFANFEEELADYNELKMLKAKKT